MLSLFLLYFFFTLLCIFLGCFYFVFFIRLLGIVCFWHLFYLSAGPLFSDGGCLQNLRQVGLLLLVSFLPVLGQCLQDIHAVCLQTALPGVNQHECGAEDDFGKLLIRLICLKRNKIIVICNDLIFYLSLKGL